jgi:hypothetical protein
MRKFKERLSALAGFWQRSRVSLIIAAVLAIGIVFFGLHDVGIVLGILMAMVIMIELTRRWRKTRNFIILFIASFLGIIFLSFLDEQVVKPFVRLVGGDGAVNGKGFDIFNQIISLIILFFGVAGLITGFIGTIVMGIWRLVALVKNKGKTAANT